MNKADAQRLELSGSRRSSLQSTERTGGVTASASHMHAGDASYNFRSMSGDIESLRKINPSEQDSSSDHRDYTPKKRSKVRKVKQFKEAKKIDISQVDESSYMESSRSLMNTIKRNAPKIAVDPCTMIMDESGVLSDHADDGFESSDNDLKPKKQPIVPEQKKPPKPPKALASPSSN